MSSFIIHTCMYVMCTTRVECMKITNTVIHDFFLILSSSGKLRKMFVFFYTKIVYHTMYIYTYTENMKQTKI